MGAKLFSVTIFMRNNIIITVKIKAFESFKIAGMVSMATHNAILKNGGLPTVATSSEFTAHTHGYCSAFARKSRA